MTDQQDKTILSSSVNWDATSGSRLPVLIVLRGAQLGRRYLLNEQSMILGRRKQRATLVIPADPEISAAHCRIEYDPGCKLHLLHDLKSTNGTRVNGEVVESIPLHDGDKILIGRSILKFTYLDLVESEYHQQVDQMINIDPLTGLMVLRAFEQLFHQALEQCGTGGQPLVAMMMDMDGLKRINDTHGHQIGAQTVATVGRLLGEKIQPDGLVSRFGGDEFTAYSVGRDRSRGLELGEAIRLAIGSHRFEFEGVVVEPTISIGLAAFPEDGRTTQQLTRRADEALYRAKAAGRNCVR
ncbi:MAG TPA: GGDEF domain-containing protein [Acidobacteriota bacterium]